MTQKIELFDFFRSGASYRLRIALNLKQLSYTQAPVNLRAREHMSGEFRELNPQGLVPVLRIQDRALIQSPAIVEWLEERYPNPPLLPGDSDDRAHVRALAAIIGCDVHPLCNLRVLNRLRNVFEQDEAGVNAWCHEWISSGLAAYQGLMMQQPAGKFSFGDTPSIADVYLIPQLAAARRFHLDLAVYPELLRVERSAAELDAFARAAPERQPDAV